MAPAQEKQVGGIKGFLLRAGKSFSAAGTVAGNWTWWLAQRGGRLGLVLASTSMVVLMPLLFEINREVGMIASERTQVTELRNQGHSDRQLQEMGFLEASLHSPAVASLHKAK